MNPAQYIGQSLNLNFGSLSFSPSYLQAGLIIFLLFILVLTMAQFRRHLIGWSARGGIFGIFIGFLFALAIEGFLIIGGKTAFTELIGWQNAPKPIRVALEAGRARLVTVLGVSDEIPVLNAQGPTSTDEILKLYQSLPPDQIKSVREMICTP
jgi:hypothetical protein